MKKPYSRDTDQSHEKQCLISYVPSPGWTVDFLCLEIFNYPPLFIKQAKIFIWHSNISMGCERETFQAYSPLEAFNGLVCNQWAACSSLNAAWTFLQVALPSRLQHHHPSIPQQNMQVFGIIFSDVATFKRISQSFPCSLIYLPLLNLLWVPERGPFGPIFLPFNQPLSSF